MRGRILFVAGLATGYVLGAKAGRKRYDQIAAAASRLWNSTPVQKNVDRAEDFVRAKAPQVADLVEDGARRVVHAATAPKRRGTTVSKSRSSTAKSGASRSASGSKSTGSKAATAADDADA